ncbi:hypothetical protein MMC25_003949 [Agyrium rufum]|nr:hypothetical protein [Agyrium rufum]
MAQEDVENSVNGKSNGTGTPSLAMNGRTTSDELGEEYRMARDSRSIIPKFDRTMSDICQDELYNPDAPLSAPTSQPRQNQSNLLSPFRGVFSERLQEANHARSGPPPADSTRSRSPFRQGFEFAGDQQLNGGGKPVTRFGSESALREQQKAKSDADALQQQQSMNSPNMQIEPTTVSPKEVKLDYQETEEDAKMLLFPRSPRAPASKSQAIQASPLARTELSQPPPAKRRNLSTSNNSFRSSVRQLSSESSTQSQNNAQMHAASTQPPQIPHQYPFIPQLPSQASSLQALTNRDPEFPAHLTSMETSKSDATSRTSTNGGHRSSGGSTSDGISTTPQITRPASTTADSGTYSCTFHGCAQRFNSAIKLNKHRREGHRDRDRQSSTPYSTGTSAMNMDDGGSGSVSGDDGDEGGNTSATSSAAGGGGGLNSGASRNSQAGPHRCSQINPSTGKPCNSIFSRPYDLTRHEDTIHNSRKQKVRCTLCAEEKTFSRNDALTRHMRVVHPEIDFPGKNKKRGGKGA